MNVFRRIENLSEKKFDQINKLTYSNLSSKKEENFESFNKNVMININNDITTVFISGIFNILHPGHLRLFQYAKNLGNRLIIGVVSDLEAKEKAHFEEDARLNGVISNIYVDEALIMNKPLKNIIHTIKPNFIVKGKEHERNFNVEQKYLDKYGGKLVFCSGETSFSSSYFIEKNIHESQENDTKIPLDYIKRHSISNRKLNSIVNNFSNLNVCVIGDLIIDEYVDCETLGMSQEDPTIVVSPIEKKKFIGGAGIVAAHSSSLGAKTTFISIAGNDENSNFAKNTLKSFGVQSEISIDESRPTTLKQRFRADNKTLLRVSQLHQNSISLSIQKKIISFFKNTKNNFDLIVFSDFNYGCLPKSLIEKIINFGKEKKITMVADSQSSSQVGDITKFNDMDLITPTEKEARLGIRSNDDGLVVLAEKLKSITNSKNIFLKLGAEGVLLHIEDKYINNKTDKIPALNSNPLDVAGAGDSMLISSAMSIACGASPLEAAYIGSIAASVQVSRVGNIPLKKVDLISNIKK